MNTSTRDVAPVRVGRPRVPAPRVDLLNDLGFLPYQVRWLRDPKQFKIGLWSRQTGKDYTCAAEALFDCQARPGVHWLIIAASERQALESFRKVKGWAERLRSMGLGRMQAFQATANELSLANGSRITALPAKPATIRGFSANVILTEFAFHEDQEALWQAVFPIITNEITGTKKLRIITTPGGRGNLFDRLWHDSQFSKHRVTIHEARSAGLSVNIETLRQGICDPEAWVQEYECQFIDGNTVLLPYELIDTCVSRNAIETSSPEDLSRARGRLFAGIDFGRKHDLTVCWILERLARGPQSPIYITREVLVLERMSTPDQFIQLAPRVELARRACLDATGAGVGLGDLLTRKFGAKIELCNFTPQLKQELFPKLRAAFERGSLQIPPSGVIKDDLHGIQRIVSHQGQITYRASYRPDGHSDRCTALALGLRAAESEPAVVMPSTVERTSRYR
jgi:phage FluMu gp28-like protein